MFFIKLIAKLSADAEHKGMITLLSSFGVKYHSIYKSEGPVTIEMIVVDQETREGDLRLAEMCFQMNYRQEGKKVCSVCSEKGKDFCGHLTFVPIMTAF